MLTERAMTMRVLSRGEVLLVPKLYLGTSSRSGLEPRLLGTSLCKPYPSAGNGPTKISTSDRPPSSSSRIVKRMQRQIKLTNELPRNYSAQNKQKKGGDPLMVWCGIATELNYKRCSERAIECP